MGRSGRGPGLPARGRRARGRTRPGLAGARAARRVGVRQLRGLPAEPGGDGGRAGRRLPLRRPGRPVPCHPAPARARRPVQLGGADRGSRDGLGAGEDEPAGEDGRRARRRATDAGDLGGHARPCRGRPSVSHHVFGADAPRRASAAPGRPARRRAGRSGAALRLGPPRAARARRRGGDLHAPLRAGHAPGLVSVAPRGELSPEPVSGAGREAARARRRAAGALRPVCAVRRGPPGRRRRAAPWRRSHAVAARARRRSPPHARRSSWRPDGWRVAAYIHPRRP